MELDIDLLKKAFLYLKSYTYFENLNLFMKRTVSNFECGQFDQDLKILLEVLNSEDVCKNATFQKWLEKVDYRLLPKGALRAEDRQQKEHNESGGLFLSNVTTSVTYDVEKLNYLIDAPAELHIIEVLWCLIVGPALEKELTKDCYGNRLSDTALAFNDGFTFGNVSTKSEIFKRYFEQYSSWRDQALDCASEISKSDEDVAFLSLDLKSFFYEIDIDFTKISAATHNFFDDEMLPLVCKLNEVLEQLYAQYYLKIKTNLDITHPDSSAKKGLPVGLASSAIIANWYLVEFDKAVAAKVRPEYYGRYVDDILIVFKSPTIETSKQIESFIDEYLDNLIVKSETDENYLIKIEDVCLPLQRDKLILQFFDKDHSRAGLEVFKKERLRKGAVRFDFYLKIT